MLSSQIVSILRVIGRWKEVTHQNGPAPRPVRLVLLVSDFAGFEIRIRRRRLLLDAVLLRTNTSDRRPARLARPFLAFAFRLPLPLLALASPSIPYSGATRFHSSSACSRHSSYRSLSTRNAIAALRATCRGGGRSGTSSGLDATGGTLRMMGTISILAGLVGQGSMRMSGKDSARGSEKLALRAHAAVFGPGRDANAMRDLSSSTFSTYALLTDCQHLAGHRAVEGSHSPERASTSTRPSGFACIRLCRL